MENISNKVYNYKTGEYNTLYKMPSNITGAKLIPDSYSKAHGSYANQTVIDVVKDTGVYAKENGFDIKITGTYSPKGAGHNGHYPGTNFDGSTSELNLSNILKAGKKLANDPRVEIIYYYGPGYAQLVGWAYISGAKFKQLSFGFADRYNHK